jgi:uncharacterized membrane protein
MADSKSLQKDSKYNKYDIDDDGVVDDAEMQKMEHMIEFENKDKKEDQLRQMAWMAMGSMVLFTGILFSPLVSIEKLNALGAVLQMFYLAQAGVVATFFGANAYVSK